LKKGNLVAYAAIFSYNTLEAKISGMVHPEYRRRGLARALIQAASQEIDNRGIETQTLIVPTRSTAGQAFAKAIDATFSFSEYEMDLAAPRELANRNENLHLKPVMETDIPFFGCTISQAFDVPEEEVTLKLGDPTRHYNLIALGEASIGTIAARTEEKQTMIYGFAVKPEHQGRVYGRQALNDMVAELTAKGNSRIRLEVDCHNEGALGLYLSCGFEVTSGYDYYKL
jgi:ribosomal protein S18 acetylase RimI-like enzyme